MAYPEANSSTNSVSPWLQFRLGYGHGDRRLQRKQTGNHSPRVTKSSADRFNGIRTNKEINQKPWLRTQPRNKPSLDYGDVWWTSHPNKTSPSTTQSGTQVTSRPVSRDSVNRLAVTGVKSAGSKRLLGTTRFAFDRNNNINRESFRDSNYFLYADMMLLKLSGPPSVSQISPRYSRMMNSVQYNDRRKRPTSAQLSRKPGQFDKRHETVSASPFQTWKGEVKDQVHGPTETQLSSTSPDCGTERRTESPQLQPKIINIRVARNEQKETHWQNPSRLATRKYNQEHQSVDTIAKTNISCDTKENKTETTCESEQGPTDDTSDLESDEEGHTPDTTNNGPSDLSVSDYFSVEVSENGSNPGDNPGDALGNSMSSVDTIQSENGQNGRPRTLRSVRFKSDHDVLEYEPNEPIDTESETPASS